MLRANIHAAMARDRLAALRPHNELVESSLNHRQLLVSAADCVQEASYSLHASLIFNNPCGPLACRIFL